jgi:SNF2 family DNA or RNA helicase
MMFEAFLEQAGLEKQPHQFEAVDWCLKKEKEGHNILSEKTIYGGIIADEMGLGKTIQLAGTMYSNEQFHTLIVLPKALLDQWTKVIKKMLKQKPLIYHGIWKKSSNLDHLYSYPVVITTYGMISENKRQTNIENDSILHKVEWDRIIFDEAHHMRNKNTNIFKGALKLKSKIKWLVTGTPIQNKREDLYSLCAQLGLPTKYYTSPSNMPELCKNFILKRTKESTGLKLPELKIHNIDVLWSNSSERNVSEDIHSGLKFSNVSKQIISTPVSITGEYTLVTLLRAKQSCILPQLLNHKYEEYIKYGGKLENEEEIKDAMKSSSKMDTVIKTILERKNGKAKLIFCHFRGEIDYIQEILSSNGLKVESFDGRTNEKQRNSILTSKHLDALILQIQTGCEGLNLQQFSEVYFITPHWNPAIEDQAIARCHRFGQKEDVEVFRFNMNGFDNEDESSSLDSYATNIQDRKRVLMKLIE